jgi:hypothetical protein
MNKALGTIAEETLLASGIIGRRAEDELLQRAIGEPIEEEEKVPLI